MSTEQKEDNNNNKNHTIESKWLTRIEAAQYMSCCKRQVEKLHKQKLIQGAKAGRTVVYSTDELDRYLDSTLYMSLGVGRDPSGRGAHGSRKR